MGLKRRNPARTRLLTAPQVLAAMATPKAPPPANVEPAPAKTAEAKVPAPAPAPRRITNEERHQMIAKAAYGRAERAGFTTDPLQNWLMAEREIDAQLAS